MAKKTKAKAGWVCSKTEGGSGGKRGHSNQCHWMYTEEIKVAAKKARRIQGKTLIRKALYEIV